MQFGRGFQCSLVMFYNPDPATMASFTALAHVEQNVRGARAGEELVLVRGLRHPGASRGAAAGGGVVAVSMGEDAATAG